MFLAVCCLLQRLGSLPSRMGCISKDTNVMGDVVQASLSDESSLECWSMFLQCMFSFLVKGGMSLQTPVLWVLHPQSRRFITTDAFLHAAAD